jgi:predicted DNA-binding protein
MLERGVRLWHNEPQMSKNAVIRFRCEPSLKERFEALAALERRTPADLARIVIEDYVQSREEDVARLALNDAPSPASHRQDTTAGAAGKLAKYSQRKKKSAMPKTS